MNDAIGPMQAPASPDQEIADLYFKLGRAMAGLSRLRHALREVLAGIERGAERGEALPATHPAVARAKAEVERSVKEDWTIPADEDETAKELPYYLGEGGKIWKRPVSRPQPDGSNMITIGFMVCQMNDVCGEEGARAVVAALNAAAARGMLQ